MQTFSNEVFCWFIAGNQSVGTNKCTWVIPNDSYIVDVRADAGTAPATTALIVDVNKNGTTVFTTQANRPTIAAAGNASTTVLPDVTAVAAGDRLSFDVDQVGTGTVGADLAVTVTLRNKKVV